MQNQQEQVATLCRQVVEGMVTGQPALIRSAFVTEGGSLTHITGYVQPLEEWLAAIAFGDMTYYGAVEVSLILEVGDRTARATLRQHLDARIWGSRSVWPLELTYQLLKIHGNWLILSIQARTFSQ